MLATMTSKGQITVPKEVRDRLNLDAGALLDFQIMADNTLQVRAVKPDAKQLRGLLKSPHPNPLTAEQMDEGIARHFRDRAAAPTATRARKTASSSKGRVR